MHLENLILELHLLNVLKIGRCSGGTSAQGINRGLVGD